ncbi:UDP-galactopyranose mutase [Streptomyces sp. XD-27]|uniref:UDP-galactopyranose mutase n=1 Tax=Streptomyces sp. XD-27 TaxID=3062779 RepID=UPI0026F42868|nr:UDP-galactopyranose mutase [Streptomyces sp. XD-27]WKX69364.1 UDP-galactopyranose mutase [Streptomyces sp. XD-27]
MSASGTASPQVAVVGAGWSGATAARLLHDAGLRVHIFERTMAVGGHSRSATVNGVLFEPEGPHIFHTSKPAVKDFAVRHGMRHSYEHKGLTQIFLDDADEHPYTLSWPPQVAELHVLPVWPAIEKELSGLPPTPCTRDFESHCVSIMGRTLYRLFIEGYTIKQWGCHPSDLSSTFAPSRLGLRTDGNRRLFRDTWEFFPLPNAQEVMESMTRPIPATFGQEIAAADLPELERAYDAVVLTVPLDTFAGRPGRLEWRGIRTVSRYIPLEDPDATVTPGYIVNHPSLRVPYTRTVESKHASGQSIPATVVTEEYPGAPARHYPVLTTDSRNERENVRLQEEIRKMTRMSVFFCGRLANYEYINQDVALDQGMSCANDVIRELRAKGRNTREGRAYER